MSQMTQSIVFIDANVSDIDHLLNGVLPDVSVKLLDATTNGIDQITDYLKTHPTSVVHIVSHGAPGRLFLGNNQLDLDNLEAHASDLASWFTPGQNSTLLLYGCNVAAGDAGAEFIEKLHKLTGAAIGASTTKVGNSAKGGSWWLNTHYQAEGYTLHSSPFSPATLEQYAHTFELPGAHSAQVGAEVFLGGNYIELGLSSQGDYGTEGDKPINFFGTDARGTIGMSADFDGFNVGNDFQVDYFLPGSPEERWVVGYQVGDTTFTGSNSAQSGGDNIPTTVTNTSSGSALSATVDSTFNSALKIDKVVSFDVDDKYFKTVITLTNISGSTLDSVRYMRSFDPDNTVDEGGDYSTINTVIGTVSGDGYAAVRATTTGPGDPIFDATGSLSPIFLISDDPRAVASYFGFSNTDPYDPAAYASPPDRGISVTDDIGITLTFDVGSLTAGQSTSFSYYTSLDDRKFSEVLAEIYPDLPLINSDPIGSVTISGTPAVGEPLTVETFALDDPDGLGEFSYRWEKSVDGSVWDVITGATGSTFTPTFAEGGKLIRTVVSFTDGEGSLEEIASSPTSSPVDGGSGYVGIFWQHRDAGQIAFWLMDNVNIGSGVTYDVTDALWQAEAVGDLNGDKKPDLIFQHAITNESYAWIMDGTEIVAHGLLPEVGPDWDIVETGDFNNDGQDEILWRHDSSGQLAVWYMESDGLTIKSGTLLNTPEFTDMAWDVVAVADFTKNGNMDILWWNEISGEIVYWNMEGENFVGGALMDTYADTSWTIQGAADFNQDGNTDLLWENIEAGQNVVWFMNGLAFNGGTTLTSVEADWVSIV